MWYRLEEWEQVLSKLPIVPSRQQVTHNWHLKFMKYSTLQKQRNSASEF